MRLDRSSGALVLCGACPFGRRGVSLPESTSPTTYYGHTGHRAATGSTALEVSTFRTLFRPCCRTSHNQPIASSLCGPTFLGVLCTLPLHPISWKEGGHEECNKPITEDASSSDQVSRHEGARLPPKLTCSRIANTSLHGGHYGSGISDSQQHNSEMRTGS